MEQSRSSGPDCDAYRPSLRCVLDKTAARSAKIYLITGARPDFEARSGEELDLS